MRTGARTYEIVTPGDWAHLVRAYPYTGSTVGSRREHTSWSIAYPNTGRIPVVRRLATVDGQRATAVAPAGHHQPDWRAVAGDFDGVHLTWAGFLTTEGFVAVDDAGMVSLLRYWLSERTCGSTTCSASPHLCPSRRSRTWAMRATASTCGPISTARLATGTP